MQASTLIAVLFAGLLSSAAFAGDVTCSSADRRVALSRNYSDGGAFHLPVVQVELDGATVYASAISGAVTADQAELSEAGTTQIAFQAMTATTPQIRTTFELLTLTGKTGAVLYADYVICKDVSRPCPFCP